MHQTLYYWYQIWQLQLWRQRLGFNSLTQSQVQTYSTAYNPNKLPEGKMPRSSSESSFVSADILEEATSHLSIASLASQQAAATHGGPRTMVQNPRITEVEKHLWDHHIQPVTDPHPVTQTRAAGATSRCAHKAREGLSRSSPEDPTFWEAWLSHLNLSF